MRSFEDLVTEAEDADVTGWGFGWLEGRANEQRPSWGYARLLEQRLAHAGSALDIDTGGGEVVNEASCLPRTMVVTESWAPNAERAREILGARGVRVVATDTGGGLPFDDSSFDVVSSRHPVKPDWSEIHRVLRPGGCYLAQHVGPSSAFELIEFMLGPLSPQQRSGRDPKAEAAEARAAGLTVDRLRTARCRMEFGPYPRILDTGCDYAAGRSVLVNPRNLAVFCVQTGSNRERATTHGVGPNRSHLAVLLSAPGATHWLRRLGRPAPEEVGPSPPSAARSVVRPCGVGMGGSIHRLRRLGRSHWVESGHPGSARPTHETGRTVFA
ncbi:methyltransferase family protein [Yimella lutea]|uniref:Methyltransferase family protein n=2 Tax=Yimella lutea TaxID=587872 RepID=A0A542EH64_9MICO|nr:methyltransferase domain-containing protein [Yimella lutea]TQJ14672.1 methyltransferase family protein [Yimella lutea]